MPDRQPQTDDWIVATLSAGGALGGTASGMWALYRFPADGTFMLGRDPEWLKDEAARRASMDGVAALWKRETGVYDLLYRRPAVDRVP